MAGEQVALYSTVSMGEEEAGKRVEGANRGGTKTLSEPCGSNYHGACGRGRSVQGPDDV